MGYVSDEQRKAVHAHKADGGKGHPAKATNLAEVADELEGAVKAHKLQAKIVREAAEKSPAKKKIKRTKISGPCKAAAKKKFKVWPSAYASGWGVRCTRAGGPSKMGKRKKKK